LLAQRWSHRSRKWSAKS